MDAAKSDSNFKCPACNTKYSVEAFKVDDELKKKREEQAELKKKIVELETKLAEVEKDIATLIALQANLNKCGSCGANWAVGKGEKTQESGFKCPSCASHNALSTK